MLEWVCLQTIQKETHDLIQVRFEYVQSLQGDVIPC
jgi:hypothetical protein